MSESKLQSKFAEALRRALGTTRPARPWCTSLRQLHPLRLSSMSRLSSRQSCRRC